MRFCRIPCKYFVNRLLLSHVTNQQILIIVFTLEIRSGSKFYKYITNPDFRSPQ